MDSTKTNSISLLGTLVNSDESGIIANSNQIYDSKADKSVQDRITDLEGKITSGGGSSSFTVTDSTLVIE